MKEQTGWSQNQVLQNYVGPDLGSSLFAILLKSWVQLRFIIRCLAIIYIGILDQMFYLRWQLCFWRRTFSSIYTGFVENYLLKNTHINCRGKTFDTFRMMLAILLLFISDKFVKGFLAITSFKLKLSQCVSTFFI